MAWFHRHEWTVTAKTFAPPRHWNENVRMSEHIAERLLAGVTTVLLRCSTCGDVKAVEMLGPEVPRT